MAQFIDRMDSFDINRGNFKSYKARFEQFLFANEIPLLKTVIQTAKSGSVTEIEMPNPRVLALFVTYCGQETYEILEKLLVPESITSAGVTYVKCVALLEEHFKPTTFKIFERVKFYKRDQQPGESIADYVINLKQMSMACEFGEFYKEALRDKFVSGLKSESTQMKLISMVPDVSFEDAIKIASSMESTKRNVNSLHNNNEQVNKIEKKWESDKYQGYKSNKDHKSKFAMNCKHCGRRHDPQHCPAKEWDCFKCNKKGHTSRVCQAKEKIKAKPSNKRHKVKKMDEESDIESSSQSSESENELSEGDSICMVVEKRSKSVKKYLEIQGKKMSVEIDSGAAVTVMNLEEYKRKLNGLTLKRSNRKLGAVNESELKVIGEVKVLVWYNKKIFKIPLVVVDIPKITTLVGRNWLDLLEPNWREKLLPETQLIQAVQVKDQDNKTNQLKLEFSSIFAKGPSTITGFEANIHLKEKAAPRFRQFYHIPYALKENVKICLETMVQEGVLKPVYRSEWASPIVVVPKVDGQLRICADFKMTLNKCIDVDKFPLPQADDIFAILAGGIKFAVIDLKAAYQQLRIGEESKPMFTINTPFGLFRYQTLTYGVSSAPAIFQRTMEEMLKGIDGVAVYLDDIITSGKSDEELTQRLREVMTRLQIHNVKVNEGKCQFYSSSVEFLGYRVTATGIKVIQQKIQDILAAKTPSNKKEVGAYVGMLVHYHRFLPNVSHVLKPLHDLLGKENKFYWSTKCEKAFEKTKRMLAKSGILMPFVSTKSCVVATDASPFALGAVLLQKYGDEERPVKFASCTLSPCQQKYSQLEKEALAIIFGVKKFHKFLYGRQFKIVSDHQPLKMIFSPDKPIPTLAAARIQRWSLTLSAYSYEIDYRKGIEMKIPDYLSRFVIPEEKAPEYNKIAVFNELEEVPLNHHHVAEESNKDPVLRKIKSFLINGWIQKEADDATKTYFEKQLEMSLEEGCVMWGRRVVIPNILRNKVLEILHNQHTGMTRMKMLARSSCWWPNMDSGIELYVKQCKICALSQANPVKSFEKWKKSEVPFERVHIDFFKLFGKDYFILVDSHTKWMEIKMMKRTQTSDVLEVLDAIQACFGIIGTLVSDNGPPFSSSTFEGALKKDGINLLHSPPYTPESNGLVEKGVSTVKKVLKKELTETSTKSQIHLAINKFHFKYRNTPSTATGKTPAEMILKFKPTTFLDFLIPNKQRRLTKIEEEDFEAEKVFVEGEKVLVKLRRDQDQIYQSKILKSIGKNTYLVNINNTVKLVHNNQLRKSWIQEEKNGKGVTDNSKEVVTTKLPEVNSSKKILSNNQQSKEAAREEIEIVEPAVPKETDTLNIEERRYPVRIRKPVDRLKF